MRVIVMQNGHYKSVEFNDDSLNGNWEDLCSLLFYWSRFSSDGLASFDTETTRHDVWTDPDCTGGLKAAVYSQSY